MGSQFAIVYDILIAVVLVFAIFSGAKRGFVSAVVGIAAVFVGFFCAMTFSAPLPLGQGSDSREYSHRSYRGNLRGM